MQHDFDPQGVSLEDVKPCSMPKLFVLALPIDGFHSVFHHRNWRAKGSCDMDIDQSAGSMVM